MVAMVTPKTEHAKITYISYEFYVLLSEKGPIR